MRTMIRSLITERAKAWEQAKAITDRATTEDRSLTAEEWQTWEKHNEDISELSDRIDDLEAALERESRMDEQRAKYEDATTGDAGKGERQSETENERLRRQLNELRTGQAEEIELDISGYRSFTDPNSYRRVVQPIEERDLTVGTSTAGGDTVPTDFAGRLVTHLIENSAILRTNVTLLTTVAGNAFDVPKTTGHSSAALIAEAAAITESDPAFSKVTLNTYKFAVLVEVSRELLTDTGVDLTGYLAQEMGQAVANDAGEDFMVGDGSSKPNGLMTAGSVGVTGGTGQSGEPTADELIDLEYSVIEAYANRAFWVMRRATEGKIRKLKDTTNQYLWAPGLQIGTPNQINGRPVVTDPYVAATGLNARSVGFGDCSRYWIRQAGSVTLARDDSVGFKNDLVTFKATWRADGDLIDTTGAFKVYVGAAS